MNKRLWGVVAVLLVFAVSVHGLQATDAENTVSQAHYLEPGEHAAVFKTLPQTNLSQKYWAVSITLNDNLRTIMVVADKDGAFLPKGVVRTNIVTAQLFVQRLYALKTTSQWLVSLPTANKWEELANTLENEQFEVEIVGDAIEDVSVKNDILGLKGKLSTLSDELRGGADDLRALSTDETALLNVSISTEDALAIHTDYESIYERVSYIQEKASEYDGELAKIKTAIANLSSLDTSEKSQLISLLSPLGSNQTLNSAVSAYATLAADNEQRLSVEVAGLATKVSALEAENESRIARGKAYTAIYEADEGFEDKTQFSSLAEAAATILASENKPFWNNKSALVQFEDAWKDAEAAFNAKQYTAAVDNAEKAKVAAQQVRSSGFNGSENGVPVQSEAVTNGLFLVLGGIVAIIVLKKVADTFFQKKGKEEDNSAEFNPFRQ